MEAENKLTDRIVKSALEKLVSENKWSLCLKQRMETLLMTNSLTNVSDIYKAFQETSAVKEEEPSD